MKTSTKSFMTSIATIATMAKRFVSNIATFTFSVSVLIITLTLSLPSDASASYEGSETGYITRITSRDNGFYVVFLSGIPDQGCTFSDRAGLSPNLTGYKNNLSTIQLAIAAKWKVQLFVDGCINHTESVDNPEYDAGDTIPRLVHIVIFPE